MVQRMARFKHYDYEQTKMIPSRFADQIQPGTFEYILNHVVNNERDLSVFESRNERDTKHTPNYMERMKHKIDSPTGRHIYSKRLGTVEPVFGNLESNKGLKRFTLRGKEKVNAQWIHQKRACQN